MGEAGCAAQAPAGVRASRPPHKLEEADGQLFLLQQHALQLASWEAEACRELACITKLVEGAHVMVEQSLVPGLDTV